MRLVVTGAGGLIGKSLCAWAKAAGWCVFPRSVRGLMLEDSDPLAADLAAVSPDLVVHCAACHSPRHGSAAWPAQIAGTVIPAVRVARALPANVQLAVFLGSCEEYGDTTPPFVEAGPLRAVSPYGWAKIAAHDAVQMIARQRGFPLCWARPFLTFGPGQTGELVVPSLVRACNRGDTIQLTAGEQTRDFIYVHDVVAMLATILTCPAAAVGRTFNLASGRPRTIREVGETIRRIVGRGRLEWGALPYRDGEPMSFYASTAVWTATFGTPRLTPFEDALHATIAAASADGNCYA